MSVGSSLVSGYTMINSPAIPYSHIQHSTTETTSTAVGALPIPSIPHSISNNNNVSSGMWTILHNNYVLSGMCTMLYYDYVLLCMCTMLHNNHMWTILLDIETSITITILYDTHIYSSMWSMLNNTQPCLTRIMPHKSMKYLIWAHWEFHVSSLELMFHQ